MQKNRGYLYYMRKIETRSRVFVLAMSFFLSLISLFVDCLRLCHLIIIKYSGHGSRVIFVSNDNQIANVNKYLMSYIAGFNILYIKNARKFKTVPQFYFHFRALINVFKQKKEFNTFSHLDVDYCRYSGSSDYFALVLKFIGARTVILSREDITPYIDIAIACQNLGVKLVVVEHGIFSSESHSFTPTDTTMHIFSSQANISKRYPKPKIVYKAESPLRAIYESFLLAQKQGGDHVSGIILADTLNIRDRLLEIAKLLEVTDRVSLRLHPGFHMKHNKYIDSRPKAEAMANARLVVTGISGFAMESVYCGKPTVILTVPDDAWAIKELTVYDDIPHIRIVAMDTFLNCPVECMDIEKPSEAEIIASQELLGFTDEASKPELLTKWFL